jgi:hypothetical protein
MGKSLRYPITANGEPSASRADDLMLLYTIPLQCRNVFDTKEVLAPLSVKETHEQSCITKHSKNNDWRPAKQREKRREGTFFRTDGLDSAGTR